MYMYKIKWLLHTQSIEKSYMVLELIGMERLKGEL